MRQNWRLNSLLMEILIAVLFFALCAGMIVNTLATSSYQSGKAGQMTIMLDDAQNVADRLYMAEDMAKELVSLGFVEEEGAYVLQEEAGKMTVTLSSEDMEAGAIVSAQISVLTVSGGEIELNSTRYLPKEVR